MSVEVVTVTEETFYDHNIITVAVGTNARRGVPDRHCSTVLRLKENGGTQMDVKVRSLRGVVENEGADQVELVFRGVAECETLIQTLEFAAQRLRKDADFGDRRLGPTVD